MTRSASTVTKKTKAKDKSTEKTILAELATGPARLDHLLERLKRQGQDEREAQKEVYRLTRIGVLRRDGLVYGLAGETDHARAGHLPSTAPDTAPSGKPLTELIAEVGRPPSPERIQQRLARKDPRRFADAMQEHERLIDQDQGRAESMDEKRWCLLALAEEDLRKGREAQGIKAALGLYGKLTISINGQTAELSTDEVRKLKKLLQSVD